VDKEKKRLAPLLGTIAYLKGHGHCGAGVIGAYHSRRVVLFDGMCASTVQDGARSMACPGLALKFRDPTAHPEGTGRARRNFPGQGSPRDAA
jgi:hypothetical protein